MRISELRIENLRCVETADLALAPGLNLFSGANGAGKTSVLEAAYLLSHARSFRPGQKETLVRLGSSGLSVFAQVERGDDRITDRLGLARAGSRWQARINGDAPLGLDELLRKIAVVCFEPGTHELIGGPGEVRRTFLDWSLFHVEHAFLSTWRRYQRALKQRNALLRSESGATTLDVWNEELAAAGELIDKQRQALISRWRPLVLECLSLFLPELGVPTLNYGRGWKEELSLADALVEREGRDLARGYTSVGPHRADWTISFEFARQREHFSRGQAKLCALASVLAQAQLLSEVMGAWPVVCLDDLASELDEVHQASVLRFLAGTGAQILVSGTTAPDGLAAWTAPIRKFHVEQGIVTRLL